ncbi:MAG: flagellar hook-length control protein FliK [Nitrospirae bacterium]|nr:flagellar hook-length control protein FliK [Nitrospirota bacterium]
MQAKSEIKADSLQEGKTPAVSEFMTRNDQPVIPVIKEVTASGNEKPGFVRGGSTSNNDNGVQVFVKALGMRDKDVLSSGKNIATANAISNDGAAPAKNGFKISDDLVESRVITQNSEKASVSTIKAAVNTETLEVSPSIKGAQADKGAVEKASSKEADNVFASAIQVHQTPYDKNGPAPKETIHVSRLNELGEPIMKTLGAGDKQLVIKLAPPDLGNIQIRLTMDHGVLRADFRVDSQAVKELFSIAMPQIKNSIEDSGIKAGDFFVDLREDHYSDGGRQQDNNNQQHKQQKESKSQFFDFFA